MMDQIQQIQENQPGTDNDGSDTTDPGDQPGTDNDGSDTTNPGDQPETGLEVKLPLLIGGGVALVAGIWLFIKCKVIKK